jgi:hypothetical protein
MLMENVLSVLPMWKDFSSKKLEYSDGVRGCAIKRKMVYNKKEE